MHKIESRIKPVDDWRESFKAGPVQYWGFFSSDELEANPGKLLMMDIDFGRACSLKCPTCFRRKNTVDDCGLHDLAYDEILSVIEDAKKLGLRTVKYCGAGEPTENRKLLRFLADLDALGVGSAIFTKGHILGDDEKARVVFSDDGVECAKDLCERLYRFKTSILLSFQSFYGRVQDRLVGVKGHTQRRDQALLNLVSAGFNSTSPTRLALVCAPITGQVKEEVVDIYKFAVKRNMYPVFAYFMISGKQINEQFLRQNDLTNEEKIRLHTEIYRWNLKENLQSLEQIEREGISCMPGIHPCNQVAAGLYLTLKGNVTSCPGDTRVVGNVRKEPLAEIWKRMENRRRGLKKMFNCRCPPKDGRTIPHNLYRKVLQNLRM